MNSEAKFHFWPCDVFEFSIQANLSVFEIVPGFFFFFTGSRTSFLQIIMKFTHFSFGTVRFHFLHMVIKYPFRVHFYVWRESKFTFSK